MAGLLIPLLFALIAPAGVRAAVASEETGREFLRLRHGPDGEICALETAVVRFASVDPDRPDLFVDLIGAVHVADTKYYEQLNRLFESYDAVLYELVAPPAARVPSRVREGTKTSPVSALQRGMTTMLELDFQLDVIDYDKENLVHADFSPAEFAQRMRDRGESFAQMFFRMVGHATAIQSRDAARTNDLSMLTALFSADRALRLKQVLAEQFHQLGDSALGLDGPDGSTILTERNKRVMEVLAQQMAAGKNRLGIFYGAAHMPDLENRLTATLEVRRSHPRWLTAWDLTQPPARSAPDRR